MSKEDTIVIQGKVLEALANTQFRVELLDQQVEIICYVTGRMRRNFIKIIPGDDVTVELSPYDLTKGRIIYRGKQKKNYSN